MFTLKIVPIIYTHESVNIRLNVWIRPSNAFTVYRKKKKTEKLSLSDGYWKKNSEALWTICGNIFDSLSYHTKTPNMNTNKIVCALFILLDLFPLNNLNRKIHFRMWYTVFGSASVVQSQTELSTFWLKTLSNYYCAKSVKRIGAVGKTKSKCLKWMKKKQTTFYDSFKSSFNENHS